MNLDNPLSSAKRAKETETFSNFQLAGAFGSTFANQRSHSTCQLDYEI